MSTSPEPVVYLYHGQDEPRLKEALDAFCAKVVDPSTADLNTTRLEGKTLTLADIQAAAGAFPFIADKRLVLVTNLTESSNRKELVDGLDQVFAGLPEWTRLVFIETGLQSHSQDSQAEGRRKTARKQILKKLVNVVENNPRGQVKSFAPPNKKEFARWISNRAAHHGFDIDRNAAELLANRIGEDLLLADTELIKLSTYTNRERPITTEDVDLLTPYPPEVSIWNMVDAIGQRKGGVALKILDRLIDEDKEPLMIFGMIIRQYRLLIQMREHLDSGGTVGSASQALNMSSFVAKKMAGQANHYRLDQLERVYRRLFELDTQIKNGQIEPRLALEEFIARMSKSKQPA